MLVAACGNTAQPTPSASTGASTAPTTAPVTRGQGGDLKILYWQAPTILNAHQATGTKDADASRLVLEALASFGKDGLPVANGLGAEIPTAANGGVSKDFKIVTWKLRTGVKWSDGTPFKASDVAFTFKYQCDPATAASTVSYCTGVDSVVAKDDATVVITYKDTQPFYYQWGVGGGNLILQEAQYKSCVGAAAKNCAADLKPIGTGAYKVDTFKPGDTVTYVINENYRDATKPFFKTVTFKGGGDAPGAARAAFQTGEVDYAWNLQVDAAILKPMATASTTANLVTVYGSSVERILVNFANPAASLGDNRGEPTTQHPFFTDKAVRRALAMATDRATVAKQIYGDGLTGKASCNILTAPEPMNSKTSAALDVCKFDLAAANAELDKAGWVKGADGVRAKGGVRLEVTYQTTINAVRQKVQDIKKTELGEGRLQGQPEVGRRRRRSSRTPRRTARTTSGRTSRCSRTTPTRTRRPTTHADWTTPQIAAKANNWQSGNYSRYCNKDFDAIIAQLRTETDQAKRDGAVHQGERLGDLERRDHPDRDADPGDLGRRQGAQGRQPTAGTPRCTTSTDWTK